MSAVVVQKTSPPTPEAVIEPSAALLVPSPHPRAEERFKRITRFWVTVVIMLATVAAFAASFSGAPMIDANASVSSPAAD